jgi:hypothetical protein
MIVKNSQKKIPTTHTKIQNLLVTLGGKSILLHTGGSDRGVRRGMRLALASLGNKKTQPNLT